MRHNVIKLYYKHPSDVDWTDMDMVPASGTLDIETVDTENGPVRTFRLNAILPKNHPAGPFYLTGDLKIEVVYDSGYRIQLGTDEMPARVKVSGSETLNISCDWQDAV